MGSFLSRLPSGGLRFSKKKVNKAHAARRGIGDARNITLEEVPISISWVWRKNIFYNAC
jgi:hypothetical protein